MYLVKYSKYSNGEEPIFTEFNTKEEATDWLKKNKSYTNKILFCNNSIMERTEKMLSVYEKLIDKLSTQIKRIEI